MDDQTNQVGAGPDEAARAQESGAVALGRGGRMSRQRKSAAVLRLLRGEDLETVSRELGVTAATLSGGTMLSLPELVDTFAKLRRGAGRCRMGQERRHFTDEFKRRRSPCWRAAVGH